MASASGGGKFANGAITGTFVGLFDHLVRPPQSGQTPNVTELDKLIKVDSRQELVYKLFINTTNETAPLKLILKTWQVISDLRSLPSVKGRCNIKKNPGALPRDFLYLFNADYFTIAINSSFWKYLINSLSTLAHSLYLGFALIAFFKLVNISGSLPVRAPTIASK